MSVGSVTTGDPGTQARVTNSGTAQNAILDFVLPRSAVERSVPSEALAMVDPSSHTAIAGSALTFGQSPLLAGAGLQHQAGSTGITISEPGVYQVFFHANATVNAGVSIPATLSLQVRVNASPVDSGLAQHTFDASGESSSISLSIPVQVSDSGAVLDIVTPDAGFSLTDLSLMISRIDG